MGQIGRPFESRESCASIRRTRKQFLWNRIRNRQISESKFVRQQPIGGYICDFVCRERLLIIEVDGGQHSDSAADVIRDRRLAEDGYRVLRFWNNDVLGNLEGVLATIQNELLG
ncbi:endonuclease domain-containing protein [Bradyrhizobium lablabi]|uniref:endonuclease domain-containing protein n=1 Tax=Bradyrhizobium lablabi TaxID=722472 RepID=UPI003D9B8E82